MQKIFDVTIIGLSYETLEPGIYMQDLVNKTYQVPYPAAGQDVLFDRNAYINQKEGIDFLLPIWCRASQLHQATTPIRYRVEYQNCAAHLISEYILQI